MPQTGRLEDVVLKIKRHLHFILGSDRNLVISIYSQQGCKTVPVGSLYPVAAANFLDLIRFYFQGAHRQPYCFPRIAKGGALMYFKQCAVDEMGCLSNLSDGQDGLRVDLQIGLGER